MSITMTFKIVSAASGKVLDVSRGSSDDRAQIIQFDDHDGVNQLWRFITTLQDPSSPSQPTGLAIQSVGSGKVLDVEGGSNDDSAPIIQFQDHGGSNQRWRLESVGNGLFRIVSAASGKVLDVEGGSLDNGARVIQFRDHGGPNQRWKLILAGIFSAGPKGIRSQLTGLVLDVRGGSLDDRAQIIQFADHRGANQRWVLQALGRGFFSIISSASEKVLDVTGGSLDDGAAIIQFQNHGGHNQQWQFLAVGSFNDEAPVFKVASRSSGKVLGLGPSHGPGAVIQQSSDVGSKDQQWSLLEDFPPVH
jgi:hypothetical protein